MPDEPLSEHCSLMARPGGPAKPAERPADCPIDAVYIKGSGGTIRPGNAPFPFIFEGGDGDDKVVVVGQAKGGLLMRGGKGNDTLTIENNWVWLARQVGPTGILLVAAFAITLAGVVVLCWRALRPKA